jgi:GMP synthase (glutamine-hydrolysing)
MNEKKILVLNILFETQFKTSFDSRMTEALEPVGIPYDTLYLEGLSGFDGFDGYTHLLISGSTESATGENDWYAPLDAVIRRFRSEGKPVLGICFGHQFLVRHILGKEYVRQSPTPEIGWTTVSVTDNPLFKNIGSLKAAVFHYDEVCGLDDRFEVIASSERCAVHGFQVKGEPTWGVQFHPDFIYRDVFDFVEDAKKETDRFEELHCRTATTHEEFRACDQLFVNWLNLSPA